MKRPGDAGGLPSFFLPFRGRFRPFLALLFLLHLAGRCFSLVDARCFCFQSFSFEPKDLAC